MQTSSKIWFITGSSTGFGRSMTETVLKNGDIVIATLRKPAALDALVSQYPPSRLLVLELDVTQPQAITIAFNKAQEVFGRIDVVFNNAGYGVVGEVESCVEEDARAMFDVNFWGAVNVSREAVRFFREVNTPTGGRLLQVGSMLGIRGFTNASFYCASKHALEGFSKSLASEIDPTWNIKITIIEPGTFRTNMVNNVVTPTMPHPAYEGSTSRTAPYRELQSSDQALRGDADKATAVIYRFAALPELPLHFPLGKDCIEGARKEMTSYLALTNELELWSEDVDADD